MKLFCCFSSALMSYPQNAFFFNISRVKACYLINIFHQLGLFETNDEIWSFSGSIASPYVIGYFIFEQLKYLVLGSLQEFSRNIVNIWQQKICWRSFGFPGVSSFRANSAIFYRQTFVLGIYMISLCWMFVSSCAIDMLGPYV